MKCQSLFTGKNTKMLSVCHLLNLPRVVKLNMLTYMVNVLKIGTLYSILCLTELYFLL